MWVHNSLPYFHRSVTIFIMIKNLIFFGSALAIGFCFLWFNSTPNFLTEIIASLSHIFTNGPLRHLYYLHVFLLKTVSLIEPLIWMLLGGYLVSMPFKNSTHAMRPASSFNLRGNLTRFWYGVGAGALLGVLFISANIASFWGDNAGPIVAAAILGGLVAISIPARGSKPAYFFSYFIYPVALLLCTTVGRLTGELDVGWQIVLLPVIAFYGVLGYRGYAQGLSNLTFFACNYLLAIMITIPSYFMLFPPNTDNYGPGLGYPILVGIPAFVLISVLGLAAYGLNSFKGQKAVV